MFRAFHTHYARTLDLFIKEKCKLPYLEHTAMQPFRRKEIISHIAISVLPGTHFHRRQVNNVTVKCLAQGHNIEIMSQY